MAEKILMIALSPTMEEGTISAWKVKEGDEVKNGALLCEVETDKAVMEYESPVNGTVLKILLEAGGSAKIGELIAVVGKPGENIDALLKEAAAAAAPAAAATPPTPDRAAPPAGPTVGTAAVSSAPPAAPAGPAAPERAAPPPPAAATAWEGPLGYGSYPRSSPLARKLARDRGLDIRSIPGTGPEGRVVRRDVEGFTGRPAPGYHAPAGAAAPEVPAAEARAPAVPGLQSQEIPVTGMRAAIARRLGESAAAPHFFLRAQVEMDSLMDARAAVNASAGEKLSLNAFFMKLAAEAIKRHPRINSTWKEKTIQIHGTVDIGLAVALPDGLITPVVRDCGGKTVSRIDAELAVLIDRARRGGLKPEEYSGATFSISNLGNYGIEEFTAIINPPGSAILALGETRREPVLGEDDELKVRRIMRMTLTCDHRTIDGAVGAAFLRDLKLMLQEPLRALV